MSTIYLFQTCNIVWVTRNYFILFVIDLSRLFFIFSSKIYVFMSMSVRKQFANLFFMKSVNYFISSAIFSSMSVDIFISSVMIFSINIIFFNKECQDKCFSCFYPKCLYQRQVDHHFCDTIHGVQQLDTEVANHTICRIQRCQISDLVIYFF